MAVRTRNSADRPGRRGRKKAAYRKQRQNFFSMVLVSLAVLSILCVVAYSSYQLKQKIAANNVRIEELQEQIDLETKRAQKIEEFRIYTQTKGFVEEMAQDKLGLVYDGEILFKQEQ